MVGATEGCPAVTFAAPGAAQYLDRYLAAHNHFRFQDRRSIQPASSHLVRNRYRRHDVAATFGIHVGIGQPMADFFEVPAAQARLVQARDAAARKCRWSFLNPYTRDGDTPLDWAKAHHDLAGFTRQSHALDGLIEELEQVSIRGVDGKATYTSGHVIELEGRAPHRRAGTWTWSLAGQQPELLRQDASGQAQLKVPFVLEPTALRVTATFQETGAAGPVSATATIQVQPHGVLALLAHKNLLGPDWMSPRIELLAEPGALALGTSDRQWGWDSPSLLWLPDHAPEGLARHWLMARGKAIYRISGDDGKAEPWVGGDPGGAINGTIAQMALDAPGGRFSRCLFLDGHGSSIRWVDAESKVHGLPLEGMECSADCGGLNPLDGLLAGIAVRPTGEILVSDQEGRKIYTLSKDARKVETLAGAGRALPSTRDGAGLEAHLDSPGLLALDGRSGDLYVVEGHRQNQWIRRITPQGQVTTLVSRRTPQGSRCQFGEAAAKFNRWTGVKATPDRFETRNPDDRVVVFQEVRDLVWHDGCLFLLANPSLHLNGYVLRKIDLESGKATDLAAIHDFYGSGIPAIRGGVTYPCSLGINPQGGCVVASRAALYEVFVKGLAPRAEAADGLETKADSKGSH